MSNQPYGEWLGQRIRDKRLARRMTLNALGAEIDPELRHPARLVLRWEQGERVPDARRLTQLCTALRTTPNQLLGFTRSRPSEVEAA